MTKYHHRWVLGISLLLSILIWIWMANRGRPARVPRLEAITVVHDSGWGYEIRANDSLFISQPFIPGMPGRKGFPREEQAKKAADIVLEKLRTGRIPILSSVEREEILESTSGIK